MWPAKESQYLLCVERLIQIADALAAFPTSPEAAQDAPQFIHSFAGPLLGQLPPATSVKALYVAAPFFGNSLEGINALTSRYKPTSLHVFPAIHSGEATDLPSNNSPRNTKAPGRIRSLPTGRRALSPT